LTRLSRCRRHRSDAHATATEAAEAQA
jgi:hypothetical protein